jgi:hypothetical protein
MNGTGARGEGGRGFMYGETNDRIQRIQSKILAGKASISDLKSQITDNNVKRLLQQASNWFDDVAVLFLRELQHERIPPRTLAEESKWLDHAEFFLERVAVPQLQAVKDMIAKFGPTIRLIG